MRRIALATLVLIFVLSAGARTYAQIAADPLIPAGTLILQTGAYNPLPERDARVYVFGGSASGTQNETNESQAQSITQSTGLIGVDYNFKSVVYSLGFQETQYQATDNNTGAVLSSAKFTQDTGLVALTTYADRINFEARVLFVSERIDLNLITGGASVSQSYTDSILGMSADLSEHFRAGFNLSPEVHTSAGYSGALGPGSLLAPNGADQKLGHGASIRGSLAYNRSTFNLSVDAFRSLEDDAARAAATQGSQFHLGLLLGNFVLLAEYAQAYQFELVETDSSGKSMPISPGQDISTATLGIFASLGTWKIGVVGQETQKNGRAYGDPALNTPNNVRLENSDTQAVLVSILKIL